MLREGARIYMAGAGGMLGEAFHEVFANRYAVACSDIDVNAPWLRSLDFRDAEAYRREVEEFRPDYLFHLGAHTGLEFCEQFPDDAYETNTKPVEHAVAIAKSLDIPLLYISTAGIFDGAKDTYDDWDEPNPLGHYARSKFLGERYVVENYPNGLICRAGWMMGGGPPKDKKFIQKLAAQLRAGASEVFIVDDKLGTPTYTIDFARNVELMLANELTGIFNLVCAGVTSRLDVATHLVKELGLERTVRITPVSSDYFAAEYFAARPPSERLLTTRLDKLGLNIMRDWRTCLSEYVAERYAGYVDRSEIVAS